MNMPRRVSLNACDFVIFSQHRVWLRTTGGGNFPYMMVELEGEVESSSLSDALIRALSSHPILTSSVRTAALRFRPFWVLPENTRSRAEESISKVYLYEDLRQSTDAAERLEALCQSRYNGDWYQYAGPQVRLEHYALPGGRTRLVLRWPHYLMDAEGAQQFLASLGDEPPSVSDGSDAGNSTLSADSDVPRVLSQFSRRELIGIIRKGMRARRALPQSETPHVAPMNSSFRDYAHIHRHWRADAFTRMRSDAKNSTPAGPALFSRFLAAAVCRAQNRLQLELGAKPGAFFITFPMRVGFSQSAGQLFERRPLIGNYLVAPTISVLAAETEDRAQLAEVILGQVQQFLAAQGDIAQWALLELAALWHAWFYHWIFKLPLSVNQCSSGFSYYGEIKGHLRSIGGLKVLNIWGGGPTTTPPAWNPVFSKFGDQLNLSVTYSRPAISDDLAQRYVNLIDSELLSPA